MNWFEMTFTVAGGLGIFLYGLSMLSESLQATFAHVLKRAITWLTTHRLSAVLVGVVVTSIIQSSSITTVMAVSFVNAGLMTLSQAVGVIFGANVGTTVTGWIIAIKVGKYGLLMIGLGILPILGAKRAGWKTGGKLVFALGMIFYGLQLMSHAFAPLRESPGFWNLLQYFRADSLLSLLGCVGIGCLTTMIIQSSSALLGITIALASEGVISFETAAGLVLGENIGTTITANLASIGANTMAKRAARAHTVFNVVGVLIIISIFPWFTDLVDTVVFGDANYLLANGKRPYAATHIAAAHSFFNVTATLVALPFLNYLVRLVTWLVPEPKGVEKPRLSFLDVREGQDVVPELAIEQARQEVRNLAARVSRCLKDTRNYLIEEQPNPELSKRVKTVEAEADELQKQVFVFLSHVLQGRLQADQTAVVNSLIRGSDELESVTDYCLSLLRYKDRLFENQTKIFSPEIMNLLVPYFDDTVKFVDMALKVIDEPRSFDRALFMKTLRELNLKADEIRDLHLRAIQAGIHKPLTGLTFSDMVVALRRIKNHALNLAEAFSGGKLHH